MDNSFFGIWPIKTISVDDFKAEYPDNREFHVPSDDQIIKMLKDPKTQKVLIFSQEKVPINTVKMNLQTLRILLLGKPELASIYEETKSLHGSPVVIDETMRNGKAEYFDGEKWRGIETE